MLDYASENVTKSQKAYATIKNAIIQGQLAPGQGVSIRELSSRFEIGFTPMNDAMKRLIYEGWLVSVPNVKTMVAEINFKDRMHCMQVRGALEIVAGRLCAQTITNQKALEFEHCLNKAALAISTHDYQAAAEEDIEFHLLCARMSENPILYHQSEQLILQDQRIFYAYLSEEMRMQSHREHEEIVKAIIGRDADQAERSTRLHIERLLRQLEKSANETERKS